MEKLFEIVRCKTNGDVYVPNLVAIGVTGDMQFIVRMDNEVIITSLSSQKDFVEKFGEGALESVHGLLEALNEHNHEIGANYLGFVHSDEWSVEEEPIITFNHVPARVFDSAAKRYQEIENVINNI